MIMIRRKRRYREDARAHIDDTEMINIFSQLSIGLTGVS